MSEEENNKNNNDNNVKVEVDVVAADENPKKYNNQVTSAADQKTRESEAVEKEQTALRKSSKKFDELSYHPDMSHTDDELRQTVRLLVMAEQTDALTAVLMRLNGDRNAWEMAQREPITLVTMIVEEQQKRMEELQKKLEETSKAKDAMGDTQDK